MAVNQDAGWGRFDNINKVAAPRPAKAAATPAARTPKKTTARKKSSAAVGNPYDALRTNLNAGLNQAQQGAFTRGPAGYAQAGMMADRVHNMLSYDMPEQSAAPAKKQPGQFGQKLGHAIISTLQFGNQVRLGMQGRGPGQPNERRRQATPFAGAGNRSGTTKPYGRNSVYGVLHDVTY